MNKSIKKFFAAVAGVAMAVGVVAGATSLNRMARPVYATNSVLNLNNLGSGFTNTSSSNHTGTFTVSGYSFAYYGKKQGNAAFVPKSADSGYFYNTTAIPGDIVSLTITTSDTAAGSAGYAVAYSSSSISSRYTTGGTSQTLNASTTSSAYTCSVSGARYFCVYMSNAKNGQVLNLSITYSNGGGGGNSSSTSQAPASSSSVLPSSSSLVESSVSVNLSKTSLILDMNGLTSGTLVATANVTGSATAGLTAASDDTSVVTVSTETPTSGTAFTLTAQSVGTAHITVASSWNPEVYATCEITVVDTTPRLANFKKVDSLVSGQKVLITTIVDGDYYLLSSATSTGDAPAAVSCTYDALHDRLRNVDAYMAFTVSGNSEAWQFTNTRGNYLYVSGNDNNRIRVGDTSHSFTATETDNGYYVKSNSYTRYLGVYNKADWRCYNSRTASNYKGTDNEYNCDWISFWVETKPVQTITGANSAYTDETVTLTSSAASPTWSIVAGDTTAAGAAITSAGIVSVTGPGTVKVKASHDDYDDAYKIITFTVRPVLPFVEPNKTETSGYTGQNETLSFTFGNFTSSISIESDDTSIVTVNTPSINGTSGTVQINFIAGGTANVVFKDGANEVESVAITVYESTVTISGLPSTSSVFINQTINLGSTISVSTTGSCSNGVTWESEDDNIAEVSSTGVVTGKALGTVDITVTSSSYPSATMTCSVTVVRTSFTSADSFQDGHKYIIAAVGYSNPNELYYLPAGTEIVDSNPSATQIISMANLTKADAWTASVDDSDHIVFSNEYEGNTYYLTATNAAQGISISDSNSGYWVLDGTGLKYNDGGTRHLGVYNNSSFRYYSSLGSGAVYANVFYEYVPSPKEKVEILDTQTSLAYRYQKDGEDNFTYSDIVMRFGAEISKDLWNELDTDSHEITGFGVILMDGEAVKNANDVADAMTYMALSTVSEDLGTYLAIDYFVPIANMNEKIGSTANSYFWNLRVTVDESEMDKMYTAVAYIKVGDEYVLMNFARESVETLALDYLVNRNCNETTADGSLQNIVDNAA